ncbi:MAG: hypothetical protein E6K49_15200 [Gammaproteobacteria bacterium]|nr:MAG: hypothetical protein E6K49_15200 [Gammaproteobacteria bacterium]
MRPTGGRIHGRDHRRVEIAREQHSIDRRCPYFHSDLIDQQEQLRELAAGEQAALRLRQLHPHRPQHQVDQDQQRPPDLFEKQQQGGADGGQPSHQRCAADQQHQGTPDVPVTQEREGPELAAIAGGMGCGLLLEPLHERLELFLRHGYEVRNPQVVTL